MSSGVTRVITGSIKGTGASIDIKTVGFRPRIVNIYNSTGTTVLYWQDTMADAAGYKMITAGTNSFITTLGITPLAGGFRIGADTDVNVSGEVIHWSAHE